MPSTKATPTAGTSARKRSYLSTIFNAGRAYSLQYPDDPGLRASSATLTVADRQRPALQSADQSRRRRLVGARSRDWVTKHSGRMRRLIGRRQALLAARELRRRTGATRASRR